MMIHTEISFIRKKTDDGFGFACMKAAYLFGITGRMEYNHEVKIHAEGERGNIEEFIAWIKENEKDDTQVRYNYSFNNSRKYKEFDIFRQTL
ncbi:MAG: acylphosphatase [Bacteroidales bacterium]|nr:acylphosphatase [Bacteroidales bacterium]